MGRGSSKAGGSLGSSTAGLPPVTQVLAAPTPAQVASGSVLPQGGVPYSKFEQMTDDEKADVIDTALQTGVPVFLEDSGLQRFVYFTGMSDKPTTMSDSALDKIQGDEIFRTVHDAYNPSKDIGYTSKDICDQISKGDFTMYSDSGGSAYGKGIYFANGLGSSTGYAKGGRQNLTMRAKVKSSDIYDYRQNNSDYKNALARGDKLAKACSKAEWESQAALYALAKGRKVLADGRSRGDYYMVLNRSALNLSSTYKDPAKLGGKWK